MSDDATEERIRARALEWFKGAYGSDFDLDDAEDRHLLEQLIQRLRKEETAK